MAIGSLPTILPVVVQKPVDLKIVLLGFQGACKVDEEAARLHGLGGPGENLPLAGGRLPDPPGREAPARIGMPGDGAGRAAGGIDEHAGNRSRPERGMPAVRREHGRPRRDAAQRAAQALDTVA